MLLGSNKYQVQEAVTTSEIVHNLLVQTFLICKRHGSFLNIIWPQKILRILLKCVCVYVEEGELQPIPPSHTEVMMTPYI